jgi:ABC-2 type transport system permease protein
VSRLFRPVIQTTGLLRKEIVEVLRQPRLLVVLIVAPFIVLLLFAVGYDQKQVVLRTVFVTTPGSVYQQSLERTDGVLDRYLTNAGVTGDRAEAERRLASGDVDLVVVFPPAAGASVMNNEQAVIEVIHDKLDPIQQTAVDVAAQVAVAELNASVLERVVGQSQQAVGEAVQDATNGSQPGEVTPRITEALAGELATGDPTQDAAVRAAIDAGETGASVLEIDPGVIVRPFRSNTVNTLPDPVSMTDFFAPAAMALLLQHMVLTMAAMSLVSDRTIGLFEIFRVGPIGAGRIVIGKYLAHVIVGGVVAAALVMAVSRGLGVPFTGSPLWAALAVFGLISASIGLGMVLSLVAGSAIQAVQYAMLVLLCGLFFGGFLLEIDAFRYPVKALSWALPVTYGVRLLRDVMLRGVEPATVDLAGLAGLTVLYGMAGWALLARRLRVS